MTTKITKLSAKFYTTLSKKVNVADVTATLNSASDLDGDTLPSGRYGFTIDEGNSSVEYVEADLVGTALSGIKGIDPTTLVETTGFVKEHRAGAEVKITDFTVLARLRNVLLGVENLDDGAPIKYGSAPTLSDPLMLATVQYVLETVNGGTVAFDSQIIAGIAGEAISSGQWVYFKESDGRWYLTDANTQATVKNVRIGMAKGAGTTGNSISGGVFVGGIEKTGTYVAGTTYYLSNTAGALSTSAGEYEALVGIADANAELFFLNIYDPEGTTPEEKDALAGTTGTPNGSNKYVTDNNLSSAGTDQSQTTQDSTIEVGSANATTQKNKLAQSFIPTKNKIRGVALYKSADTGTFTGTVKIALQGNSGGSPDGSDLVSRTLTNSEWQGLAIGANEILFTSEYTSLLNVPSTTYWIVISTSTADNSNRINLGFNTAGGYANGTLKYNNTSDGWVEVTGDDLYFKTIDGITSQVVKTNSSGKIESVFYDVSEMPIPAFMQDIAFSTNPSFGTNAFASGSNIDGSVLWIMPSNDAMYRLQRDSITGQYLETHVIDPTLTIPSGDGGSIINIGDYIYLFTNNGTNIVCSRFLASDLTGEQVMTVPTVPCTTFCTAWTDSKYAYVLSDASQTTSRKWSVNETVFTAISTATAQNDVLEGTGNSNMFDGTTLYGIWKSTTTRVSKSADIDASSFTTTVYRTPLYSDELAGNIIINIDKNRIYIGTCYAFYDETAKISSRMRIIPITKP